MVSVQNVQMQISFCLSCWGMVGIFESVQMLSLTGFGKFSAIQYLNTASRGRMIGTLGTALNIPTKKGIKKKKENEQMWPGLNHCGIRMMGVWGLQYYFSSFFFHARLIL